MARTLDAAEWAARVKQCAGTPERDRLIGLSVTLAARLLGVTRSRVHQLIKTKKLAVMDVYDETHTRIGHLVTIASIEHRRRTVRPRRTQWRPVR